MKRSEKSKFLGFFILNLSLDFKVFLVNCEKKASVDYKIYSTIIFKRNNNFQY